MKCKKNCKDRGSMNLMVFLNSDYVSFNNGLNSYKFKNNRNKLYSVKFSFME